MTRDENILHQLEELRDEAYRISDAEPVRHYKEFYPQGDGGFYEDETEYTDTAIQYWELAEDLSRVIKDFKRHMKI